MRRRRTRTNIALVIIILILALVLMYSGLQILEATVFNKEQVQETQAVSKTITRNGVDYFPKQDMTVVMVLGIDNFGPVKDSGSYNNDGVADMAALLVFDESESSIRVLALNRDTMADVPVLGLGGKYAGTVKEQLGLAHTYGSGLEDSCENMKKPVSDFLYGLNIDYYVAMNMDAIALVNDAVGGVKVVVEDDFSAVDATLTKGEHVLKGEQAVHFVRSRQSVGDNLNLSRMERQEAYMNGLMDAVKMKLDAESGVVATIYEQVSDYMVTDLSVNAVSGMLERYGDYSLVEIVSPEGENVLGEKYYEYYVDEAKLDELILRLFYAPKR